VVDCGAISPTLIESELFGHEKGAFTAPTPASRRLRQADGGTVFLDEIGELPLDLQSKLLRFVQEKQFTPVGSVTARRVDVRIIAATNVDLRARVAEGRFREDLFHRLNVRPPARAAAARADARHRPPREHLPPAVRRALQAARPPLHGAGGGAAGATSLARERPRAAEPRADLRALPATRRAGRHRPERLPGVALPALSEKAVPAPVARESDRAGATARLEHPRRPPSACAFRLPRRSRLSSLRERNAPAALGNG
jgi:hypothetical protein